MRDRGVNPFPFRCGLGPILSGDSEYPLRLTLAEAVALWARPVTFQARLSLQYPGLTITQELTLERDVTSNEHQLRDSSFYGCALFYGRVDFSTDAQSRTIGINLMLFGAQGFYPERERAYWSGVHAVKKRTQLVPGEVWPRVVLSVEGFWDQGSEYVLDFRNVPISGEENTPTSAAFTAQLEGNPIELRGVGTSPTTASLTIARHGHFQYARQNATQPVYTPNGIELLDPRFAKVEV